MAQNERQGMEAAGRRGAGGSEAGTESSGAHGSTGTSAPPVTGKPAGEEGRTEAGSQPVAIGREREPSGSRLSRREGWDDFTGFFGGSPFALFRRLSEDMDRLFFGSGGQGLPGFGGFGARFLPHVDVNEREGKMVIEADLPGCRPEDFHIDIEDDSLVLEGERRSHHEETRGGVRRSERTYGTFRRVIPLPPGANAEAADAQFDNGVLEITIPLKQQARARRLEIHSGGAEAGASGSTVSEPTRH
jgi:HSP20 family protein